ncbi:hypothetical protein BpHYR1_037836 [Brachionus plicatilis]|uniref:Uncharacterized protein n=1 Tax=Brachionus plicatilis TaxID=10195 RepID=A0A3M7QY13_BRAPC|nr:hypothetical protein BpHYR1_037836 [Brachionus plicatilis]
MTSMFSNSRLKGIPVRKVSLQYKIKGKLKFMINFFDSNKSIFDFLTRHNLKLKLKSNRFPEINDNSLLKSSLFKLKSSTTQSFKNLPPAEFSELSFFLLLSSFCRFFSDKSLITSINFEFIDLKKTSLVLEKFDLSNSLTQSLKIFEELFKNFMVVKW